MLQWIKNNSTTILTVLVCSAFAFYMYACQATTRSLMTPTKQVNRQELQLELDQIIGLAQLRMVDLDQQEQFRSIILENALILVQGNPLNPVGLLTAFAGIYGVVQGSRNITKVVKTNVNKRKTNNG